MKQQRGYIAIASVLVISAVAVIIGTAVALQSINEIQTALSHKKGQEALQLVEGCTEDALIRLNKVASIPATITIPQGTCSVTINSNTGNNWTFTIAGTINNYTKRVQVSATRGTTFVITSWQEL